MEKLETVFGERRPSQAAVYRWYSEFNRGRTSLTDKEESERPRIGVTPDNVLIVENLIKRKSPNALGSTGRSKTVNPFRRNRRRS